MPERPRRGSGPKSSSGSFGGIGAIYHKGRSVTVAGLGRCSDESAGLDRATRPTGAAPEAAAAHDEGGSGERVAFLSKRYGPRTQTQRRFPLCNLYVSMLQRLGVEEHAFLLRTGKDAEPQLSDEHVAYRWVSPDEARAAVRWKAHRDALDLALKVF